MLLIKLSYIAVDSQHHEPATSMPQHHAPQHRPECLRTVRSGQSNLTVCKHLQFRIARHCFNIPLNKVIKVIFQHLKPYSECIIPTKMPPARWSRLIETRKVNIPPITTSHAEPRLDKLAVSANGTVSPSAYPMITSQTMFP
jgi:hypothetical protein